MPTASLDSFTLVRGSLWRSIRYAAFFIFIMLCAMCIKSALDWQNRMEWTMLSVGVWVGTLVAGPVEALSQRSVRNARRLSKESGLAMAFASIWAGAISALVALLAFPLDRNFLYLVFGSAAVGAILAVIPPTTGGRIE